MTQGVLSHMKNLSKESTPLSPNRSRIEVDLHQTYPTKRWVSSLLFLLGLLRDLKDQYDVSTVLYAAGLSVCCI